MGNASNAVRRSARRRLTAGVSLVGVGILTVNLLATPLDVRGASPGIREVRLAASATPWVALPGVTPEGLIGVQAPESVVGLVSPTGATTQADGITDQSPAAPAMQSQPVDNAGVAASLEIPNLLDPGAIGPVLVFGPLLGSAYLFYIVQASIPEPFVYFVLPPLLPIGWAAIAYTGLAFLVVGVTGLILGALVGNFVTATEVNVSEAVDMSTDRYAASDASAQVNATTDPTAPINPPDNDAAAPAAAPAETSTPATTDSEPAASTEHPVTLDDLAAPGEEQGLETDPAASSEQPAPDADAAALADEQGTEAGQPGPVEEQHATDTGDMTATTETASQSTDRADAVVSDRPMVRGPIGAPHPQNDDAQQDLDGSRPAASSGADDLTPASDSPSDDRTDETTRPAINGDR